MRSFIWVSIPSCVFVCVCVIADVVMCMSPRFFFLVWLQSLETLEHRSYLLLPGMDRKREQSKGGNEKRVRTSQGWDGRKWSRRREGAPRKKKQMRDRGLVVVLPLSTPYGATQFKWANRTTNTKGQWTRRREGERKKREEGKWAHMRILRSRYTSRRGGDKGTGLLNLLDASTPTLPVVKSSRVHDMMALNTNTTWQIQTQLHFTLASSPFAVKTARTNEP